MAVQVIDSKCSGCGAPVAPGMSFCDYCGNPVVITSFNSILDRAIPDVNRLVRALDKDSDKSGELAPLAHFTKGACYLKLRLHDKALAEFEAAIDENLDNPEGYFYAAVSLLKGKKAFLTPLPNLKKALEYLEAAESIENRGVFWYFAAYIKQDYFARKCLRISPDWREEAALALQNNLSPSDARLLFDILAVPCPPALAF